MPRLPRHWNPGAGAHIISRFVDRRFHLVDDIDRCMFLESIGRAHARWDWLWLSYALMSSHVHYGLLPGIDSPDRFFRSTHTRFAQRYHARPSRQTLGPVFAARPAIHPVETSELLRIVAYHHRNPVEAGVVPTPRESTWTSHRAYLRLEPAPPWLDIERALTLLGFRDDAAGRRRFDEFVIEADLSNLASRTESRSVGVCRGDLAEQTVDWARLMTLARAVAELPPTEPLDSRSRRAATTRRIISIIATRDLRQTYECVAAQLDMRAGSVFNLVARRGPAADLDELLHELRSRMGLPARRERGVSMYEHGPR